MFWIITGIVTVILSVVFITLHYRTDNMVYFAIALLSVIWAVFMIVVVPIGIISSKQNTNRFVQQKQYIENHMPESDVENAAITNKKIELNSWLYDAQYSQANYTIFSFHNDSIQELEPIK